MNENIAWTKVQQANTLAGIEIVRTIVKNDETRGPVAGAETIMQSAGTMGLDGVVTGLANLCAILTKHIEDTTGVNESDTLRNAEKVVKNITLRD